MQRPLRKIVVIGPESTGKSTLSQALALSLNTCFSEEYARIYLEQRNNHYDFEDLRKIAEGQLALEDHRAVEANDVLICDTDLYVLAVWSCHKYGKVDPYILQQIATRHYDGYILCNIDMPWQPDPQREHPDEASRAYFLRWYRELMTESGRPFVEVSGNETDRLQTALRSGLFP